MNFELEKRWRETVKEISIHFGEQLDIQSIIFLVGAQELNKGFLQLSKDKKLEVMHIGVCAILEVSGYYNFLGRDEDGWPHFENIKKLPAVSEREQEMLMKEAIIDYFESNKIM